MSQIGGSLLGAGLGGMGGGNKGGQGSNFSSVGGGQFNNSVFSGSNMPNTNLNSKW